MRLQQACLRGGILVLVLSLQAGLIRAEEGEPRVVSTPPGPPLSAGAPQTRQAPPDTSVLQSQALLASIDKILKRAAAADREGAKGLPTRDNFLLDPVWTETREEREKEVRELLDSALAIVTDAPILKLQEDIRKQQDKIAANRDRIATFVRSGWKPATWAASHLFQ